MYTQLLVFYAMWLDVSMDFVLGTCLTSHELCFCCYGYVLEDGPFYNMLEDHGCIPDSLHLL